MFPPRHCRQARVGRPRSRRSCAALALPAKIGGREAASASSSTSAPARRSSDYVERQGDRPLQPAGVGDTRPRDPHQEQAVVVPRPRPANSTTSRPEAKGGRWLRRRLRRLFRAPQRRVGGDKTKLDPVPRVVLVPGLGLFGIGHTLKDAAIAADIAETRSGRHRRRGIGRYSRSPRADMFDFEYWCARAGQARRGRRSRSPARSAWYRRRRASARRPRKAFAKEGAEVAVLDSTSTPPRRSRNGEGFASPAT